MPVGITKLVNPTTQLNFTGGINWRGDYDNGTAYATGDGVSYQGSSYVAIQATTGNLPTDVNYWGVLAEKGGDGANGLGIIAGGTAEQVLAKASGADYDMKWKDIELQTVVPSSTVEEEITGGLTADPGVSDSYSRGDHTHGTPDIPPAASSVIQQLNPSMSPSVGISVSYARADHCHGTPASGGGGGVVIVQAGSGIDVTENPPGVYTISLYNNPILTFTARVNGVSYVAEGMTANIVECAWTCNKVMTSRTFVGGPVPIGDRDRGSGQDGSYTHNPAGLTGTTTYTFQVSDGENTATASATIYWVGILFRGETTDETLTGAQVSGGSLSISDWCPTRVRTFTAYCDGGKYIWYCYPADLGEATFTVGGLEVTFINTVQDVTVYGFTQQYNCYRSQELQNGVEITVVVT